MIHPIFLYLLGNNNLFGMYLKFLSNVKLFLQIDKFSLHNDKIS
jgi:hypothetical protein